MYSNVTKNSKTVNSWVQNGKNKLSFESYINFNTLIFQYYKLFTSNKITKLVFTKLTTSCFESLRHKFRRLYRPHVAPVCPRICCNTSCSCHISDRNSTAWSCTETQKSTNTCYSFRCLCSIWVVKHDKNHMINKLAIDNRKLEIRDSN